VGGLLPIEPVMTALVAIDDLTSTPGRASSLHRGVALKANSRQGVALDKRGETNSWLSHSRIPG
jgi:hypothetical protein